MTPPERGREGVGQRPPAESPSIASAPAIVGQQRSRAQKIIDLVPLNDIWLLNSPEGPQRHYRSPIVAAGRDERGLWHYVVGALPRGPMMFVADWFRDGDSFLEVYRSGTLHCDCGHPDVDDSDDAWCVRCPGEVTRV